MSRTTVTTLTNLTAPRSPLLKTASMTFASAKGAPTVALSPTSLAQENMDSSTLNEKSLRHMRTLRPSDFDWEESSPSTDATAPASPVVQRIPLQLHPDHRKALDEPAKLGILQVPSGRGSLGASATTPISRLKRQKTLMPGDFRNLHQDRVVATESFVLFASEISRPESAPPQRTAGSPTSPTAPRARAQQGYARIVLTPTIEDKAVDNRKPITGMNHFTIWEREENDTYVIQGLLYVCAFQDQQQRSADDIYHIVDISLHLQTFSQNSGPYAKETEESPAYFDICDTSGKRRRTNTLINILQNSANVRETSGRNKGFISNSHYAGRTVPTSCGFTVGIPIHLFRSVRERYFRLTARATFEIGSRHPLSFANTTGLLTHSPLKLAEAISAPLDFTISYLSLPPPRRDDTRSPSYSSS